MSAIGGIVRHGLEIGLVRQPASVLFGPGQRSHLPFAARRFGTRALVLTDERMAASDEFGAMRAALEAAGVAVTVFDAALPDLPRSSIIEVMGQHRGLGSSPAFDVVIGIGGGSCMDLAKVVSVLLVSGGDVRDIYGEFNVPAPGLPVIAVPTTGGTGAEVTCIAVVLDDETRSKVGIASPHLEPACAIIDPELTLSCPPGLTAATAADALTHLVETYTAAQRNPDPQDVASKAYVGKNRITDMFCRSGFEAINAGAAAVVADPSDIRARGDMMFGAYCAGMAINTAGTAAAHAIQAALAAYSHAPHGFGVGALLPYVMRFNLPYRMREFAEIGHCLGASNAGMSEIEQARAGVQAVENLLQTVGAPLDLKAIGVVPENFSRIAAMAMKTTRLVVNNPGPMTEESVSRLLARAYDGDRSWWDAP